jgi:hypothetical protein
MRATGPRRGPAERACVESVCGGARADGAGGRVDAAEPFGKRAPPLSADPSCPV